MKFSKKLYVFLSVLVLSGVSLWGCSKGGGNTVQVGSKVAAQWGAGSWYLASVTAINGDQYSVKYDDGNTGTVGASGVKLVSEDPNLKTGDPVLAIWSDGDKFYDATVQEVKGEGYVVKWTDGSEPALVAKNAVVKK